MVGVGVDERGCYKATRIFLVLEFLKILNNNGVNHEKNFVTLLHQQLKERRILNSTFFLE